MSTTLAQDKTKKVNYMYKEIEITRSRLHEINVHLGVLRQDKLFAKTYRDSLVIESKSSLLKHEHAVLMLRLYDLMEEMTYRPNDKENH